MATWRDGGRDCGARGQEVRERQELRACSFLKDSYEENFIVYFIFDTSTINE